jgi:hypothetical protein
MTTRPLIDHSFDNSDFQKHYSDSPPTHSPDLAPCDFFVFPKMKLRLKGRRFDTTEEIHAETQFRTSRDAWNHGKHAGITVYMPKGTTSKEKVETTSYGEKLFLWSNSPNFWVSPRIINCAQWSEDRFELRICITSLPWGVLSPARIGEMIRGLQRWGLEMWCHVVPSLCIVAWRWIWVAHLYEFLNTRCVVPVTDRKENPWIVKVRTWNVM